MLHPKNHSSRPKSCPTSPWSMSRLKSWRGGSQCSTGNRTSSRMGQRICATGSCSRAVGQAPLSGGVVSKGTRKTRDVVIVLIIGVWASRIQQALPPTSFSLSQGDFWCRNRMTPIRMMIHTRTLRRWMIRSVPFFVCWAKGGFSHRRRILLRDCMLPMILTQSTKWFCHYDMYWKDDPASHTVITWCVAKDFPVDDLIDPPTHDSSTYTAILYHCRQLLEDEYYERYAAVFMVDLTRWIMTRGEDSSFGALGDGLGTMIDPGDDQWAGFYDWNRSTGTITRRREGAGTVHKLCGLEHHGHTLSCFFGMHGLADKGLQIPRINDRRDFRLCRHKVARCTILSIWPP